MDFIYLLVAPKNKFFQSFKNSDSVTEWGQILQNHIGQSFDQIKKKTKPLKWPSRLDIISKTEHLEGRLIITFTFNRKRLFSAIFCQLSYCTPPGKKKPCPAWKKGPMRWWQTRSYWRLWHRMSRREETCCAWPSSTGRRRYAPLQVLRNCWSNRLAWSKA